MWLFYFIAEISIKLKCIRIQTSFSRIHIHIQIELLIAIACNGHILENDITKIPKLLQDICHSDGNIEIIRIISRYFVNL